MDSIRRRRNIQLGNRKDEAFRQDFRELMWEEIYRIGDQDSLFKPLGNWIGYGGTIIYANITGQDRV